jgi:hypothetical protein
VNAPGGSAPLADEATLSDDQLALVVGGVGGDNLPVRALLRELGSGTRAQHGQPLPEAARKAWSPRG